MNYSVMPTIAGQVAITQSASSPSKKIVSKMSRPSVLMVQYAIQCTNFDVNGGTEVQTQWNNRLQTLAIKVRSNTSGRRVWTTGNLSDALKMGAIARATWKTLDTLEKMFSTLHDPVNAYSNAEMAEYLDVVSNQKKLLRGWVDVTPVHPIHAAIIKKMGYFHDNTGKRIDVAALFDELGYYHSSDKGYISRVLETNFESTLTPATTLKANVAAILADLNMFGTPETMQAAADIRAVCKQVSDPCDKTEDFANLQIATRNAASGYQADAGSFKANSGGCNVTQTGPKYEVVPAAALDNPPQIDEVFIDIESRDRNSVSFDEACMIPWAIVDVQNNTANNGYLQCSFLSFCTCKQIMAYCVAGTDYTYAQFTAFASTATSYDEGEPGNGPLGAANALCEMLGLGLAPGFLAVAGPLINNDGNLLNAGSSHSYIIRRDDTYHHAIKWQTIHTNMAVWFIEEGFDRIGFVDRRNKPDSSRSNSNREIKKEDNNGK